MAKVYWSIEAVEDFEQNIKFLEERFSETEVQSFIDKTDNILNIISISPKTFQSTGYKNVHFVPIVRQVNLYYRITNEDDIELVRFWNNSQNKEDLNL